MKLQYKHGCTRLSVRVSFVRKQRAKILPWFLRTKEVKLFAGSTRLFSCSAVVVYLIHAVNQFSALLYQGPELATGSTLVDHVSRWHFQVINPGVGVYAFLYFLYRFLRKTQSRFYFAFCIL